MKRKLLKIVGASVVSVMLFGTSAFAGIDFIEYMTVVGRFNGIGYTEYQKKNTTGTDGYIISDNVGGDYVVDARLACSLGNGAWTRDVDDNETRKLAGTKKQTKGCSVRTEFSNDWNTPVVVTVRGKWMSN